MLFQAFYNFARPHMSWRLPVSEQASHASGLIQPKWRHRTPGMAAGLTDHVWTFRELLTAKFEPIHTPTVSLGVTYALAYTYGSDDGRIWSVRCAVIVAGLDDR